MNASTAIVTLAEGSAPVFLMSVAKPLVTLVTLVAYVGLSTGKLAQDASYYNVSPRRWAGIFLGCGAAGLLAATMLPWTWGWFVGYPLMLAILVAPCWAYIRARNVALAGKKGIKPIKIGNIDWAARSAQRRAKAAAGMVRAKFMLKDRSEHPIPDRKDPAFEVYAGVENLLLPALEARASRVDVALTKQGAQVGQTVDSVRFRRDPVAGEAATAIVDLLKRLAGLDAAERRKFQRGSFWVVRDGERTAVTVTSMGSMQGENVRIDFEREKQLSIPADRLGMTEAQATLLAEITSGSGTVLLGARAGNGLTTLAYALLGKHDALLANIRTLERRMERNIDGVEHQEFAAGQEDYAKQLQTIVRRGPNVALVTEVLEPGAAKVMAAPGSRDVLFYGTLASDSAPELMAAWVKAVGDPKPAAEALRAVVAMRLVRKACPTCRVATAPTPAEAKMLAIPAGKQVQIYKQSGKVLVKDQPVDCPTCGGTGYMGVTGVFEVLPIDAEARTLLAAGDVKGAYQQARRAAKSWSLQDSALAKVRAGETSFDELKRVFTPPAAAPAAGTAPAAANAAPAKK